MMGSAALPHATAASGRSPGAPVVELHHVALRSRNRLALDEVSLTLKAGSIVGIAGVDGNGQDELVEVMARVRAPTSGSMRLCKGAGDARETLAVIPQNRDVDSLILDLSLWENLLLSHYLRKQTGARGGWIRRSRAVELCRQLIDRFSVRGGGPKAPARSLSGGNRQRFIAARALAAAPAAIVAHDICRGLDLNAAAELRSRLRDYAARGGAVLLISSDLEELLALCHQLYVINRGRLTEVQSERRDLAELGLLMSGASPTGPSGGGAGGARPPNGPRGPIANGPQGPIGGAR
jgi:simple sugar transport system ATP-binding protein